MINSADTVWVIVATALVMIMTPTLAFFYGGLVNVERKSIKSLRFLDYMPDMYLND